MTNNVSTIKKLNNEGRLKAVISTYIDSFCAHEPSWNAKITITPGDSFFKVLVEWIRYGSKMKSINYDINDATFRLSGDTEQQTPILNRLWRCQIKAALKSDELREYEKAQELHRQSLVSRLVDAKTYFNSEQE